MNSDNNNIIINNNLMRGNGKSDINDIMREGGRIKMKTLA